MPPSRFGARNKKPAGKKKTFFKRKKVCRQWAKAAAGGVGNRSGASGHDGMIRQHRGGKRACGHGQGGPCPVKCCEIGGEVRRARAVQDGRPKGGGLPRVVAFGRP